MKLFGLIVLFICKMFYYINRKSCFVVSQICVYLRQNCDEVCSALWCHVCVCGLRGMCTNMHFYGYSRPLRELVFLQSRWVATIHSRAYYSVCQSTAGRQTDLVEFGGMGRSGVYSSHCIPRFRTHNFTI